MSSALEAYGQRSKAQPDWFHDNVDLLLPAVAAKRSARLKVTVKNNRSAHRELQPAKRTVQCLTRFAVSRYWENLSTRIQQSADCGDLHGLYSGIREAIVPIPKKLCPLLAADVALLVCATGTLGRSLHLHLFPTSSCQLFGVIQPATATCPSRTGQPFHYG